MCRKTASAQTNKCGAGATAVEEASAGANTGTFSGSSNEIKADIINFKTYF